MTKRGSAALTNTGLRNDDNGAVMTPLPGYYTIPPTPLRISDEEHHV